MNAPQKIYKTLLARYGNLHWWPAKTPYEVMVGAILTQNTAWSNVEKAIANFNGKLSPEFVLKTNASALADIIRPAGYYNQKAGYLKTMTEWYENYGFDVAAVQREPLAKLRAELLSTKGIGKETADSILLYAFGFPTFVVDAYTVRLCERYPLDAGKGYDAIKNHFEKKLARNIEAYNNFHAMIVINGKDHCRKKKPLCGECPLKKQCAKIFKEQVPLEVVIPFSLPSST
jgi:endonuclease-3 related protein